LRKTGKDIYKLRKTKTASKGQPDLQAFKEKMAFFTNLKNDVPVLPADEEVAEKTPAEEKPELDTSVVSAAGLEVSGTPKTIPPKLEGNARAPRTNVIVEATETKQANDDDAVPAGDDEKRFAYDIDPDIGVIV
jgi:hypothetical protein